MTAPARGRAFRRAKTLSKMWRRLKEDRNQHYNDLGCACYLHGREMARFKEQPKSCRRMCCANPRRRLRGSQRLTLQELRAREGTHEREVRSAKLIPSPE